MRLVGRRALVTGGSRGIGEACAAALAREGAAVCIVSRRASNVDEALVRLREAVPEGVFSGVALHVGDLSAIGEVFDAEGPFDILVNNAGTNPFFGPMLQTPREAWDKTFEVNVKGPFELTRQFVLRRGPDAGPASVIMMSSILGAGAAPLQGVYGMTKAALIAMTQTLSMELAPQVRVNAVAPGLIDTKLAAAITSDPALTASVMARTASKRVGRPEEVAGIVVFLASEDSAYITGQTLFVDGGYSVG